MKTDNKHYQKLYTMAPNGFIDPINDLGTFNDRLLKFEEPVSKLRNPFSGEAYTDIWQTKIEEMRAVYILWQKDIQLKLVSKNERRSYMKSEERLDRRKQSVEILLSLGFYFPDVAKIVGYSEKTLRNKWKRSDLNETNERLLITKKNLSQGKIENNKLDLEIIKNHSWCLACTI